MTLEQQVQALEQRLNDLEQQLVADQLVPGVFSLNAAGGIEEILSGKLMAQGVELPQGNSGSFKKGDPDLVGWFEGTELKEIVRGWTTVGASTTEQYLELLAAAPPGPPWEGLSAELLLQLAYTSTTKTLLGQIKASVGGQVATILDSKGRSSFLHLHSGVKAQVSTGVGVITWPGASQLSNESAFIKAGGSPFISGGLSIQPVSIGLVWLPTITTIEAGKGEFRIQGYAPKEAPAAETAAQFWWMAITE